MRKRLPHWKPRGEAPAAWCLKPPNKHHPHTHTRPLFAMSSSPRGVQSSRWYAHLFGCREPCAIDERCPSPLGNEMR